MSKQKLKPVLPSLREKKRYLAFEVISKGKVTGFDAVSNAIWQSCHQFMGQLGTAKAGIMPLENKWNAEKQKGIIKVSNKYVNHVKASFVFANKIEGKDVILRSLGVSGILNKAESKFMK
jgi:ribonuclease P/MRP protein subunit POP5